MVSGSMGVQVLAMVRDSIGSQRIQQTEPLRPSECELRRPVTKGDKF